MPGKHNDSEAEAMQSLGCEELRSFPLPCLVFPLSAFLSMAVCPTCCRFNVLRLGFMWSGYNPAPGVFNQTYIEVIHYIPFPRQCSYLAALLLTQVH